MRARCPDPTALRPAYEYQLWRAYGITMEQWQALWDAQGGLCGVCKTDLGRLTFTSHPVVDHDHETHLVRGLVCNACNVVIARSKRLSPAAIHYLNNHAGMQPSRDPHPTKRWKSPFA